MAKHIWDLTEKEVEVLLKFVDLDDYKITKIVKYTDCGIVDCIAVYAESERNDGRMNYMQEDEIVRLFPDSYKDICYFYPGFKVSNALYIQWALWCNLIDPINFDNIKKES